MNCYLLSLLFFETIKHYKGTYDYLGLFKAAQEAEEAEEMKKELGIDADDSLKALIQSRQQSREQQMDGFFEQLEAKYAKPAKSKKTESAKGKKKGKK